MTADYLIRHCSELVCCFLLPGVPAATLFLHRGASVCVLLWAGLVRQARWSGVYKVPHGEAATYLGAAEPTHLSQGSAVCHDGPHWRGRNTVTSCFLHVSVLEAFTRGLRPCRILHKWRHLLGSTQNGAASVFAAMPDLESFYAFPSETQLDDFEPATCDVSGFSIFVSMTTRIMVGFEDDDYSKMRTKEVFYWPYISAILNCVWSD